MIDADLCHALLLAGAERAAQDAAARIREAAGPSARVHAAALDLADPHSIAAFARHVIAEHGGRVGVLVNNAGFAYKGDVFGLEEVRRPHTCQWDEAGRALRALLHCLHGALNAVVQIGRDTTHSIVSCCRVCDVCSRTTGGGTGWGREV